SILGVFDPGSHGSTFGGNPLACAVSIAALDVIIEENLPERSNELGVYIKSELNKINSPLIKDIRGKGLFIGIELTEAARPYCEDLENKGLLCKDTHETVIRFAPTVLIDKEKLDVAIQKTKDVLEEYTTKPHNDNCVAINIVTEASTRVYSPPTIPFL